MRAEPRVDPGRIQRAPSERQVLRRERGLGNPLEEREHRVGERGRPLQAGALAPCLVRRAHARARGRDAHGAVERPLHDAAQVECLDGLLAELRQHAGDVVGEHAVRREEGHLARRKLATAPVQQVRHAVQRDGGLARARHALDDERARLLVADDAVLLGLDGRDDGAHLSVGIAPQLARQHLVAHARGAVRRIHELAPLHPQLALARKKAFHTARGRFVGSRARLVVLVEQRRHRRAPVGHHSAALRREREAPQVERLRFPFPVGREVHAREVGRVEHLAQLRSRLVRLRRAPVDLGQRQLVLEGLRRVDLPAVRHLVTLGLAVAVLYPPMQGLGLAEGGAHEAERLGEPRLLLRPDGVVPFPFAHRLLLLPLPPPSCGSVRSRNHCTG